MSLPPGFRYVPLQAVNDAPQRTVVYACGTEREAGSFGMWAGPFPGERFALDTHGTSQSDVIIRFNADGTETVTWRWDGEAWVRTDAQ